MSPERPGSLLERLTSGRPQPGARPRRNPHITRRPASNAQQRLWFLSRLEGPVATYSVPNAFVVRGRLSCDALDRALTRIAERHEAIRTRLFEEGEKLFQEVVPSMPIRTTVLRADTLDDAVRLAHRVVAEPFDLASPPLFRTTCIQVEPELAVLAITFHHAAFDAWSLDLFYKELRALYAGGADGDQLAEPLLQYGDYADWQREWLESTSAGAQRRYWQDQLEGRLPALQLDCRHPGQRGDPTSGAVHRFHLDAGVAEGLEALAASWRTTTFAVLLSAFIATLHRISTQEEFVVGVPVACRNTVESESIIGYLSNTIAIRASISGSVPFTRMLAHVSETLFRGLANQELPFDEVVAALGLDREVSGNPCYQAMLVTQMTPLGATLCLPPLAIERVPIHTGTAKLPLTLSVSRDSGLEVDLEYDTTITSRAQAERLASALTHLITNAIQRPDTRAGELALLSPATADALQAAAIDRCESYHSLELQHVLFERVVERLPEAIAVEAGGVSVGYAELNARANRLAHALLKRGVGRESKVPICVPRGVDLVVAMLAVHKAGAAFVPLDTEFPLSRIEFICNDVQAQVVLSGASQLHRLGGMAPDVLDVAREGAAEPDDNLDLVVVLADAAYVYYTSGSTGRPKGVVIEHRCAMTRLAWLRQRYPLEVGEKVLHKTPLIFDVAIWEIGLPLMAGATIAMAEPGAEADVEHIGHILRTENLVLAHFVPTLLDAFLRYSRPASYPSLKWLVASGEAVSKATLERFSDHFAIDLHNQYGQTETSEVTAWEGRIAERETTVPIGRAIGAYRVHILDRSLRPVPPGIPGELCVAAELGGLARGYHGSPGLTAERFVPNPYPRVAGERLYRTGDLARLTDDGSIEYLGRLDQQTKIRGCRVDPIEVEVILGQLASVEACCVISLPDDDGVNTLIAYVVGDDSSTESLRDHCRAHLPFFMRPADYMFIERLPLTSSGKVDRTRLPAPERVKRAQPAPTSHAPLDPVEEELTAIWERVLQRQHIGRSDDFFDLGGNSLRSIQVLVAIRQRYGVTVSVRDFFADPTVQRLAVLIRQQLEALVDSMSLEEVEQRLNEYDG